LDAGTGISRRRRPATPGGAGVLAYLAAWVIIPGEGETISIAQNLIGKKQDA